MAGWVVCGKHADDRSQPPAEGWKGRSMATAVEPSTQPTTPKPAANLVFASFVGAAYVVAAVVVVFYALPNIWRQSVTPSIDNSFLDAGLRLAAQLGVALALYWFGNSLAGTAPPKGLRGGIFLTISFAFAIFFIARRVGLMTQDYGFGLVLTGAVAAMMTFLAIRFFLSPRGERWMVGLEEQGWFSTHTYKRALGQKVRRLTILGFLLIGGTGVYSLTAQGAIPTNWTLDMPFEWSAVKLVPDAKYIIPIVLVGLTLWIAFRVVNMPLFAEFLIATEAEMNKVSWSTRRGLFQDTIVVLVTTVLMTAFLLFVDVFWGWLLSRETVGVLPGRAATKDKQDINKPVDW
jgi:preprotein translocase SecE subunit